jgi:hypothetical protein
MLVANTLTYYDTATMRLHHSHYSRLEMLVRDKHSSLSDPFVSYAKNEVLRIQTQIYWRVCSQFKDFFTKLEIKIFFFSFLNESCLWLISNGRIDEAVQEPHSQHFIF